MTAANALLRAIHARLSGDAGLMALIGPEGMRDRILPRQTLPAVVLGEVETRDLSTSAATGEEHFLVLEAWAEGEGRRQALEIAAKVKALLDDAALILDNGGLNNGGLDNGDGQDEGMVLVSLFAIGSRSRREPRTKAYRVEMRFRAVTE